MHKVVITHRVHQEVIDFLQPHCELILNQTETSLRHEEVINRCKDADAVMMFMPDYVDIAFLDACPNLKIIGCALRGYDNFDLSACKKRDIWLSTVPDLLIEPTAELTIALMIAVSRFIVSGDSYVREAKFKGWQPIFYGTGITKSSIGILGMGKLGQAVARRLSNFEADLNYYDISRLNEVCEHELQLSFKSFNEILTDSDYILVLLPLTDKTYHLLNAEAIASIKQGTYIVNTARGSVIDEEALAVALDEGKVAGYAADVFEFEDWTQPGRPFKVNPELIRQSDKTVFTPHLGSAVESIRKEIEMQAAKNIIQALNGEIPLDAIRA